MAPVKHGPKGLPARLAEYQAPAVRTLPGVVAECHSCDAPILWATTAKAGRAIPLDPRPTPDGNLVFERGVVVHYQPLLHRGQDRYQTHFVSCPDAEAWRRANPNEGDPRI